MEIELDHIALRTSNLPATRDFFMQLFELEEKPRPRSILHIRGHWLHANDKAIIHLIGADTIGGSDAGTDRPDGFDHVALHASNFEAFRMRLAGMDAQYSIANGPMPFERRIFVRTPGGPVFEVVFDLPAQQENQ